MDGNKLRDALRKARVFIDCSPLKKVEDDFGCIDRDEICAEIDAILAEPVKNCEVGTAEEQSRRFDKVCSFRFTGNCAGCQNPLDDSAANGVGDCALFWTQMPYEEGVNK